MPTTRESLTLLIITIIIIIIILISMVITPLFDNHSCCWWSLSLLIDPYSLLHRQFLFLSSIVNLIIIIILMVISLLSDKQSCRRKSLSDRSSSSINILFVSNSNSRHRSSPSTGIDLVIDHQIDTRSESPIIVYQSYSLRQRSYFRSRSNRSLSHRSIIHNHSRRSSIIDNHIISHSLSHWSFSSSLSFIILCIYHHLLHYRLLCS